jgi:hypothetical protein
MNFYKSLICRAALHPGICKTAQTVNGAHVRAPKPQIMKKEVR